MRNQSNTHNEIVELVSLIVKGIRTDNFPLEKGKKHLPDIITDEYDYEIEILNSTSIKKKIPKYNSSKKRVLIIGVMPDHLKHFEKVFLFNQLEEIKNAK